MSLVLVELIIWIWVVVFFFGWMLKELIISFEVMFGLSGGEIWVIFDVLILGWFDFWCCKIMCVVCGKVFCVKGSEIFVDEFC